MGFALFSFLAIDFCVMLYINSLLPFMSNYVANYERKEFLNICHRTETFSRILGASLLTIYLFISPNKSFFYFSYTFRTNLEFVYFFAILLNLISTLTVLLFWPTFFVLHKHPESFPKSSWKILKSLNLKSKICLFQESLSVALNQFCQINFPNIICSRVSLSFTNFICLSEMKALDIGASYGALNLFCFLVFSAFSDCFSKKYSSFFVAFLHLFRSCCSFVAYKYYGR